ncbi:MAG: succinate dehydrogenase assembly factor 2 [Albidovulum sp.]|nr:succinate dehydrogenase assembly factor 2 [Albidovulum sp.]MDE0531261.1 succinate dehydrogenase assembly factor 2 [Albidovulum sp.]
MSDEHSELKIKRLLIRSQRRGTLELDYILGRFAKENLGDLDDELLNEFESLLDHSDGVVFACVSSMMPVPKKIERIIHEIRAWVKNSAALASRNEQSRNQAS